MERGEEFWTLLGRVQEDISRNYSAALSGENGEELRAYIEKSLRDVGPPPGEDLGGLAEEIYREMAQYSVLTPWLDPEKAEEIDINGWDDIAVTLHDGSTVKLGEHFRSPEHAADIVRRLLHRSGMVIDSASPVSQGHLPGNTRITAVKAPVVDEDRGIAASIRMLRPQKITLGALAAGGFATREMLRFLCVCARYGVPAVIAGATSSGKTTLLNAVLSSVPSGKRIFTIESGSRELSLVRRDGEGRVTNNVVHTLSRPSADPACDISQEDLVAVSLRFNPDIVCVGEMRDAECFSAVEASLTGHNVLSTVHAGPGEAAHARIALLCQRRFSTDFATSMAQAARAFPVIAYTHRSENNRRRLTDITECVIAPSGEREYRCLYNYTILGGAQARGEDAEGRFGKPEPMSESLRRRLAGNGAPRDLLRAFTEGR